MKNDFYCLEIKIKNEDICKEKLHSHLYISNSAIEIKIYIDSANDTDRKFMIWSSSNQLSDFVTEQIEVEISEHEKVLQKIDLSNSRIISVKSKDYENDKEYFTLYLNKILIYKKLNFNENVGIAKVFLNEDGFSLVKNFYSSFTMNVKEGNFGISRMNGMNSFYKIGEIKFRPEFEYSYSDSRNNKDFKIEKVPIIKFIFPVTIEDKKLIEQISIVCNITSFYLGNLIDYYRITAFKPNSILSLTKIIKENSGLKVNSINYFLNTKGIDNFLKTNWSKNYLANSKKIDKAIENYLHSRFVDINSRFLMLYNIIEILMAGKSNSNEKFELIVNDLEKEKIYEIALTELKKTISKKDYLDFENKWKTLQNKMAYKPMKSPLVEFLEENNIENKDLKIDIDTIKQIRDKITHGSVRTLRSNIVEEANYNLYRISIKLILNQLGLKKFWETK
ncbi:hypothetical protein [Flavobacterium muglaense]|uniref:ApeA N-terminal domain-containing protein n=1 Tax=Flavobacterium muglaense TaxID=2764716 RepID=A0A923N1B2_9FLAO|nr:hypothetical protein [Flavobacterium muglaense]MBC5839602.1 hypothetical protein [Flavobacterium muglaense]MBC5846138.1 hypothetical protein [Flavobacterium muglaense]